MGLRTGETHAERAKRWRLTNPERARFHGRKMAAKRHARNRAILRERKSQPCADCGQRFPYYVMDFDHRDPTTKKHNLSRAKNLSLSALLGEIDKCDVVCANCHRIREFERTGEICLSAIK